MVNCIKKSKIQTIYFLPLIEWIANSYACCQREMFAYRLKIWKMLLPYFWNNGEMMNRLSLLER